MRRAVLRKAGHYGELDLPLVVALGALDRDARLEHVIDVAGRLVPTAQDC